MFVNRVAIRNVCKIYNIYAVYSVTNIDIDMNWPKWSETYTTSPFLSWGTFERVPVKNS
jgi:hypothetical protein